MELHILLVMDVLVGLNPLLHHLVDVVDVLGNVLTHGRVEGQLVFAELSPLLVQEGARLFEILVEVEPHLFLAALLQAEDVILDHAELAVGHVKLVDEIVAAREHLSVNDLVQFFLRVLQLVL